MSHDVMLMLSCVVVRGLSLHGRLCHVGPFDIHSMAFNRLAQANGMHQGVTSSDLLQQRPFGEHLPKLFITITFTWVI